jgi:hypothetical protein
LLLLRRRRRGRGRRWWGGNARRPLFLRVRGSVGGEEDGGLIRDC